MSLTALREHPDPRVQDTDFGAWIFVPAAARDRRIVLERLAVCGVDLVEATSVSDVVQSMCDDVLVCLIDLADDRAVAAVRAIRGQHPAMRLAGLIDPGQPVVAAEAVDAGLHDVLPWPFQRHDLESLVATARDYLAAPPSEGTVRPDRYGLLTHAPSMRIVADQIRAAAGSRGGVLVCGERGTGRSRVARAVHATSAHREAPFVEVDCADVTPDALEWRLFGVVADRVAGPGAKARLPERISTSCALAEAGTGSLLLMNVSEAPARVQARLARLLRDREVLVGDRRTLVDLDVRAMAGVSPSVDADLADGRLRRDLFERLSHTRIDVPPLRRRREDIPLLAAGMLHELAERASVPAPRFSRSALALLSALPWPGNGNELRSLLEHLLQPGRAVIHLEDVLARVQLDGLTAGVEASGTLRDAKARFERDWISAMLVRHHGRVGDAARALGIQRTNLYRKVRQLKVARTLLAPRKP